MTEHEERVVVVTGGARGVGRATVEAFHRKGCSVVVVDLAENGAQLVNILGKRALFVRCDVANGEQVEQAFAQVHERFGGVDVLVNNAGIQRYSTVTKTSEQEWDYVLGVNLKGAFLCAKHAIPSMLERGGGVVVNVSSVQAFLSQTNVAPYTTSKTALLGLTRSIAVDYAPTVRCVAVCPGTVDTPMFRSAIQESPDSEAVVRECIDMHPVHRLGTPEEVAELIMYLSSDKAGFMTGQTFRIDGGLGISVGGSKRS